MEDKNVWRDILFVDFPEEIIRHILSYIRWPSKKKFNQCVKEMKRYHAGTLNTSIWGFYSINRRLKEAFEAERKVYREEKMLKGIPWL